MNRKATVVSLAAMLALAGCATPPPGPTVGVMPAPNTPFEVFQADQAACKAYADGQVAGQAQQANLTGLGTAIVGTALGAGLGAAIGGGRGAAIGAASGAVAGSAVGAGYSNNSNMPIQQ